LKMSDTDMQLLARYTRQQAENAFAELVHRHVDLVFSTALRLVRSPELAEEVAQSTFTDLARQARRLAPDTILTAWLYEVARRTAVDAVRREARRQFREQIACELTAMNNSSPDWSHIEPILDDAMRALDAADRAAVLLRYFDNKSLREVGQALGVNEDAARKRVSRAVERMRRFFSQHGVTIEAGALAAALSVGAVHGAPAGLSATISTAALAGKTIAAANAICMTTLQKSIVGAILAIAVGTGVYQINRAAQARRENLALRGQQASLDGRVKQLTIERDEAAGRLALLRQNGERLSRNASELPALRSEVSRLRGQSQHQAQSAAGDTNDPTAMAAQAWLDREKLLKRRFVQWPGKKTPQVGLLTEQDWLNEVADNVLDTDDACRESMSRLRIQAKNIFAIAVTEAMRQFAESNNNRLPSDPSELKPYMTPPADLCLDEYELAKPGWKISPPTPWALVEKGTFTPDGTAIRDRSILADPQFDMFQIVVPGSTRGYK
jgi:RNA polymerase sigma factor (sigma-70 family)